MKGIKHENRRLFFNNFNEFILGKLLKMKGDKKIMANYKTSKEDNARHVKWCKNNGLTKTEHINARIFQDIYNTFTVKGAVMQIAKKDSTDGLAAMMALKDASKFNFFIHYIKTQCEQGNKKTLTLKHGSDVINAILNSDI